MGFEVNDPIRLKETVRAVCSKCDNETLHDVLATVDEKGSTPDVPYWIASHEIIRCRGCNGVSFEMNWQSSEDIEYDEYGDERMADHPDLFPPRLKGRKRSSTNSNYRLSFAASTRRLIKHSAAGSVSSPESGSGLLWRQFAARRKLRERISQNESMAWLTSACCPRMARKSFTGHGYSETRPPTK